MSKGTSHLQGAAVWKVLERLGWALTECRELPPCSVTFRQVFSNCSLSLELSSSFLYFLPPLTTPKDNVKPNLLDSHISKYLLQLWLPPPLACRHVCLSICSQIYMWPKQNSSWTFTVGSSVLIHLEFPTQSSISSLNKTHRHPFSYLSQNPRRAWFFPFSYPNICKTYKPLLTKYLPTQSTFTHVFCWVNSSIYLFLFCFHLCTLNSILLAASILYSKNQNQILLLLCWKQLLFTLNLCLRKLKGDKCNGRRLDLERWTHDTIHGWCIIHLYTWNQHNFINQCHLDTFNK